MKHTTLREQTFYPMLGTASIAVAIEILSVLTDNIIVGHVVGETGIAGINLVIPLFSFCIFFSTVISSGASFRYADAIGNFEGERAGRLLGMSIILAMSVGIVMSTAAFFWKGSYFDFLSSSDSIRAAGEAYYRYIQLDMLIYPCFVLFIEMLYIDGDTTLCNIAYVVLVAGNVGLSIILCMRMGTAGASLGTLIGTTCSLCVLLLHFFKKNNGLKPKFFFSLKELVEFFRFGFTDASIYLFWSALFYVLNAFVIHRFGDETMVTMAVVLGFFELTVIFDGIGQAMKPLVSIYYAEKNYIGVAKTMKITLRVALIEGIVTTVAVFLLANIMPLAFNIKEPEMIARSALALRIIAPSLTATALLYLYSSYYLNIRKVALAVWIMMWKDFLSVLPLAILLGLIFGVNGVWIGILLAPFLTLLVWRLTIRFRHEGEEFPLMLKSDDALADYDVQLTKEDIIKVRKEAEEFLEERNISYDAVFGSKILIEELSQLVMEKNPAPEKVCVEWVLRTEEENLLIIYRDNGEVIDLSNPDEMVSSFRAFFVSSFMEDIQVRKYLMTTGMNRIVFRVPYERGGIILEGET